MKNLLYQEIGDTELPDCDHMSKCWVVGEFRDLTETRTGNAPRHGQDENLMMLQARSRPMVRTIYCAVNLSVYPEPWPAYQSGVCDRCLHSTLASPLFLTPLSWQRDFCCLAAAAVWYQCSISQYDYPLNTLNVWSAKSCLQRNGCGAPDRLVIRARWAAERWRRTSES